MSGLLKGEIAQGRAKSLGSVGTRSASLAAPPADPFAAYEQRIALLESELAEAAELLPELLANARQEGREEGLGERDESSAKRLQALEAGIAQAVSGWTERLDQMNGLSVQVAKTVLDKMLGNAEWHGDFLAQAISARLSQLDASTVIAVRLSPADISTQEIAELNTSSKVLVEASADLDAGHCAIALHMGEIELGPSTQWREAAALLDRLAEARC